MSTVQNETDIGPDEFETDTEGARILKLSTDRSIGGSKDVEPPPSIVEILQDVRKDEQGEEVKTFSRKFSDAYGNILDQEEEESSKATNGDVLASPGKERPSSADGSLSNPDDTPSIQVYTRWQILLEQSADSNRTHYFLPQENILSFQAEDTVRLHLYVLLTAAFKHGSLSHL